METTWSRVTSYAPDELREATREIHHAVQLLAAAGGALTEAREDDSHRALSWHRELEAFAGEPFAGSPALRVALQPATLTLLVLDEEDAPVDRLELPDRTQEEAYRWMETALGRALDRDAPSLEPPEFEIPEHPVASGAPFGAAPAPRREAVAALYARAWAVVERVVSERSDTSPARCWPHHFDVATLLTLEGEGEEARTVGVGMAPEGGGYDEWYWYVNLWPAPEPSALSELEGPAHWHTEGWVGAVLPGQALVDRAGEETAVLSAFLARAVPAAESVMTG